jgi:hypothetical protein
MTALLSQTRLREIAQVTEHPNLSSGRLIPRLAWTVDAQTGRPVARWMLNQADSAPSARV